MDYQLALKLRNAGFSQMRLGDFYITPDILIRRKDINTTLFNNKGEIIVFADLVYKPSLAELIEACGADIEALIKQTGDWVAISNKEAYMLKQDFSGVSTPEEAVANLYLRLHGKL